MIKVGKYVVRTLLTHGNTNTKLAKSNQSNRYLTVGLSMAPHNSSGYNVCPQATLGCKSTCLYYQGRGRFDKVKRARINKTRAFMKSRSKFISMLNKELQSWSKKAKKENKKLAVRLNVLSDIPWEQHLDMTQYKHIQFYDYTKVGKRIGKVPENYNLTFSRSELNEKECVELLKRGQNVAVVFQELPKRWNGFKVINGDKNDLRFKDPKGVVVGLKAKGSAKRDTTNFVVLK